MQASQRHRRASRSESSPRYMGTPAAVANAAAASDVAVGAADADAPHQLGRASHSPVAVRFTSRHARSGTAVHWQPPLLARSSAQSHVKSEQRGFPST